MKRPFIKQLGYVLLAVALGLIVVVGLGVATLALYVYTLLPEPSSFVENRVDVVLAQPSSQIADENRVEDVRTRYIHLDQFHSRLRRPGFRVDVCSQLGRGDFLQGDLVNQLYDRVESGKALNAPQEGLLVIAQYLFEETSAKDILDVLTAPSTKLATQSAAAVQPPDKLDFYGDFIAVGAQILYDSRAFNHAVERSRQLVLISALSQVHKEFAQDPEARDLCGDIEHLANIRSRATDPTLESRLDSILEDYPVPEELQWLTQKFSMDPIRMSVQWGWLEDYKFE